MVKRDFKNPYLFMALQFLFSVYIPVDIFYNAKIIMNRMAVKWSNKSFFILPFLN